MGLGGKKCFPPATHTASVEYRDSKRSGNICLDPEISGRLFCFVRYLLGVRAVRTVQTFFLPQTAPVSMVVQFRVHI